MLEKMVKEATDAANDAEKKYEEVSTVLLLGRSESCVCVFIFR
jgi:hypothetical protein